MTLQNDFDLIKKEYDRVIQRNRLLEIANNSMSNANDVYHALPWYKRMWQALQNN